MPDQDFAEAVARFRTDLAAAVTRSRRAAAEARERAAAFRGETAGRDDEDPSAESGPRPPAPSDGDDEDFSAEPILFRP